MWWMPNARKGASYLLSEDQVEGLLLRYDSDGDGRLSQQELQAAFKELGLCFSRWRAWRALRHADINRDGFINRDELKLLVQYAKKWGFRAS